MSDTDDQPLFDGHRLAELEDLLGRDQVKALLAAFAADLERRPAPLRASLQRNDHAAIRETAHSVRGAALAVGAGRCAATALALESAATSAIVLNTDRFLHAMSATVRSLQSAPATA